MKLLVGSVFLRKSSNELLRPIKEIKITNNSLKIRKE